MKKRLLLSVCISVATSHALAADLKDLSNDNSVGQIIGWVPEQNVYNICGGYYKELPIPYTPNPFITSQGKNYDISADHVDWSLKGTSTLKGNVRITQPDKQLNAGKVDLYRNKADQKINVIRLYDHVRLFEPGKLIVARHAVVYVPQKKVKLYNAAYRMKLSNTLDQASKNPKTGEQELRLYNQNFWGTAKTITQTKPKHYTLKNASYTTCSPTCNTWRIHSTTINLDTDKGRGVAWNSVLYWKGIPVFYTPYTSFPLKKQRKTGFLTPSYGHTQRSGFTFALPFYWNIAPNYDALFRVSYLSERGVLGDAKFRYLTKISQGYIDGSFIPDDRKFKDFRRDALKPGSIYANQPDALRRLKDDGDNRYSIHLYNQSRFNDHVTSDLDFSQVSDDYYTQDFGHGFVNSSDNQLLQKADAGYNGDNWNFYGLFQNYQTLHPVNELAVQNQYARLPELQANGSYPDIWHGFDFTINNDIVNFYQEKTPDSKLMKPVLGERLSVRPTIDYPITEAYGYLVPRIQMQMTRYQLHQIGNLRNHNPGQVIPIVDVRGGLNFEKQFSLFNHQYIETLEPNFYYLYVPYRNQDDLPIFDTAEQQFDYNSMYLDNRFSGIDRIGDANQVTYGVTSRFIDDQTGDQLGTVGIGEIYYMRNRRVQLCNKNGTTPCDQSLPAIDKQRFSPIAGTGSINLLDHWSLSGGLTWNPRSKLFDNETATVAYKPDNNHIVNLNYSFTRSADLATTAVTTKSLPLKQAGVSAYWQVHRHWDLMGALNYNWGDGSDTHGTAYLAGAGYESCCWAVRGVVLREFNRIDKDGRLRYNNSYFIQLVLKGFGGVSSDDPGSKLQQYISGYTDQFTKAN